MNTRTYDDIPLEVVLPLNIVYLCGKEVGMELRPWKEWATAATENTQAQSEMTVAVWTAVARAIGRGDGVA